jgi:hypothetical protein
MAMTVVDLSRGPALEPDVEKGVHIIFHPAEVETDPGPHVLPSPQELKQAAFAIGNAKPTDVIVFRGKPWHMIDHELLKHPEVHVAHPETVLELHVGREKAVWWSEHDFTITRIELHADAAEAAAAPTAAPPPAASDATAPPSKPFPEPETRIESSADLAAELHVARSTVPIPESKTYEYKITFTRNQRRIDPNMRCI